jgi:hypothetical protein
MDSNVSLDTCQARLQRWPFCQIYRKSNTTMPITQQIYLKPLNKVTYHVTHPSLEYGMHSWTLPYVNELVSFLVIARHTSFSNFLEFTWYTMIMCTTEKVFYEILWVLTQKCYPLNKGWSHCVKHSSVKLCLGYGSSGLCPWPVWHVHTFNYFLCSTSTMRTMQDAKKKQETKCKMPKMANMLLTSHRCTPF